MGRQIYTERLGCQAMHIKWEISQEEDQDPISFGFLPLFLRHDDYFQKSLTRLCKKNPSVPSNESKNAMNV